jgi:GTP-binding protein Era
MKLGIVSPKPQSTRDKVVGIVTGDGVQMVILDTPGLLQSPQLLHRSMTHTAHRALHDADVIVYLMDASDSSISGDSLAEAAGMTRPPNAPVITTLNKVDVLTTAQRAELSRLYPDALQISATTGEGVDRLLDAARAHMPESPYLYPEEEVSSQDTRFFTRELIRETALEMLDEEVPYGIACEIEEYRESSDPVYIRAVLYVERKSQKGIVVGAKGARIRDIGKASRQKIEALTGSRVYLDLWVKVLPNWIRNESLLRRFGYNVHEESSQ